MLVLSRKRDETILIGQDIKVTVIRTSKNQVKLGIEAPEHVNIVRAELEEDDGEEGGTQEGEAA